MSKFKYPTPQLLFKGICDAIRSKTNNTDKILHQNIPDELNNFMNKEEYDSAIQNFMSIFEDPLLINDEITNIKGDIFSKCTNLTTIDLPECITIGSYAFQGCTNLTTINLPKCTTLGSAAFGSCKSLATVNLPNCTTIEENAFGGCDSLVSISLPKCITIKSYIFNNCKSLTTVNLPKCTSINTQAFNWCSNLTTVILSNNRIVNTDRGGFFYGTGYIYVPDNLVNSYKTDTIWSTYANQIKPLSELPSELKEEYGYD